MEIKEFDEKFRELYTNMVEIAFEYVNNDKEEVDDIFIYGCMEADIFFYDVFYEVNGHIVEKHKINTVANQKFDLSDERTEKLLDLGIGYLKGINKIFKEDNRAAPTLMKMTYSPKTGKFNNDISYELHFSNQKNKSVSKGCDEWFVEMGGKL